MAGSARWLTISLGGAALVLGAKLAGMAVGSIGGRVVAQAAFGPASVTLNEQIDTALRIAEESIAPTLPRRLDEVTVLTGIHHTGRVLTYSHSLDAGQGQLDIAALEAHVKNQVCNNDSMVKMIAYGVSFVYEYYGSRAPYRHLADITVSRC